MNRFKFIEQSLSQRVTVRLILRFHLTGSMSVREFPGQANQRWKDPMTVTDTAPWAEIRVG